MMDHQASVELLESVHPFPGVYRIKAIGSAEDEFAQRVVEAALEVIPTASDVDHTIRQTPHRRHVAVTLDVTVQTAEQVLAIYARLRDVPGLAYLF
jgi:putative lipoic acid-binding regulatory protein